MKHTAIVLAHMRSLVFISRADASGDNSRTRVFANVPHVHFNTQRVSQI